MPFDRRQLGKMTWYRQGAGAKPIYISYPWLTCAAMTIRGRHIPVYYRDLYGYFNHDFVLFYFPEKSMESVAAYYNKQQQRNPRFIQNLKKWWDSNPRTIFLKEVDKLERQDFTALSPVQFRKIFFEFSRIYTALWQEAIFHDSFDLMTDRFLDKYIKEANVKISGDELSLCVMNDQPSMLQEEKFALASLARAVNKNARLMALVKNEKLEKIKIDFPKFYYRLANHANMYHWIYNDYAHVVRLEPQDFLRGVKELLAKPEELGRIASLWRSFATSKRARRRLFTMHKVPYRVQSLFQLIATISQWRDDRKACNQMSNAIVKRFTEEISRRTGIPNEDVEYGLWWEHEKLFNPNFQYRRLLYKRRTAWFGTMRPNGRADIIMGKTAKDLGGFLEGLMMRKELHGRPAYPGIVRGRAVIVLDKRDFHKFKAGNILVAPNTRPEYVPIIKIASAIISEEGGLTCHAAIVSRELKVPAIVGVQGAIAALKDGDRVEVDAQRGLVKKL